MAADYSYNDRGLLRQVPDLEVRYGNDWVSLDLSEVIRAIRVLNITHMREKFNKDASALVKNVWASAVSGNTLPGMTYAVNDPDYAYAIQNYTNTYAGAVDIDIAPNYDRIDSYEDGYDPYDMKPGFLANAKHISKEGDAYAVVAFRHLTPDQSNKGVKAASVMPVEIYDMLADAGDGAYIQDFGEGEYKPQLSSMPNSGGYQHQNALYHNLRKQTRKSLSGRSQGNIYMTYRTVSEKSDPNSWHHPGKPPNPIAEAVARRLQEYELPNLLLRYVGGKKK